MPPSPRKNIPATSLPWSTFLDLPHQQQAENKTVVTRETWMEIDGAEFMPGASYVARVRCKTPDSDDAYVSQWSEWSPVTEWSVPPGLPHTRGQGVAGGGGSAGGCGAQNALRLDLRPAVLLLACGCT